MMQAINWLNRGYPLALSAEGLVKGNFFSHLFFPSFRRAEIQKTIDFLGAHLREAPYLSLSDRFIKKYASESGVKKIIAAFDRHVAPFRPHIQYCCKENQKALEKWQKANQPAEIFRDHPEFADYLEATALLNQIKITRDQVQLLEGEPALLVEGVLTPASQLEQRFELVEEHKRKLLVDKVTRRAFTYLDNGKGFQEHHPLLTTNNPISTLNEADYQRTWEKAASFTRIEEISLSPQERGERNQERPFILQIASSRNCKGETNCHKLLINSQHPYLRLIIGQDSPELGTKKGEVYEAGYWPESFPWLPFQMTKGQFWTPDPCEYRMTDERIVTNILLNPEEAHRLREFILAYHLHSIHQRTAPGFHLHKQNCTVFLHEACRAARIFVPTQMGFGELFYQILPNLLKTTGRLIASPFRTLTSWAARITPQRISDWTAYTYEKIDAFARRLLDVVAAFFIVPFRTLLGEGSSDTQGIAFRQRSESPSYIDPPLTRLSDFFTLPNPNLPFVVQQWQLQQPSTVVYARPVRLAIVPPN